MDDSSSKGGTLNRSASSPDIFLSPSSVRRRIYVEELIKYPNSDVPLIRHFSCQEIYNDKNGSRLVQTAFNHSTPISFDDEFKKNQLTNINLSFNINSIQDWSLQDSFHGGNKAYNSNALTYPETPMEVDSSHSGFETSYNINSRDKSSDIGLMQRNSRQRRHSKKTATDLNTNRIDETAKNRFEVDSDLIYIGSKTESRCSFLCSLKVLLLVVCVSTLCIIYLEDPFIFENREVQLERIRSELKENVLHQEDPVMMVTLSLERMEQWSLKMKVLPFVGSAGVGKTFIANIIKKHFYDRLVHEISKDHLESEETLKKFLYKLKSCCLNLLIVDDLKAQDIHVLLNFIKHVPKSQLLLVIPIFSVQYTSEDLTHHINYADYRTIEVAFDESQFFHEVVLFREIPLPVVEKWLDRYVNKVGEVGGNRDEIIKNVLSNHDAKYMGLKGLHSKVIVQ